MTVQSLASLEMIFPQEIIFRPIIIPELVILNYDCSENKGLAS